MSPHVAAYLDWLFSLPPSSAPQFACYLLHLTQGTLLPPFPTPPLLDSIASPPLDCYPPDVPYTPPPEAPAGVVYCTLSGEETSAALLGGVLHSRRRTALCLRMMRDGPLLAACRVAQSLLAALALPHSTPLAADATASPLQLLRSHQLCHDLRPLLSRVDWALSPAALSEEQAAEAAYYLHEVEVAQLRRLRGDLARLLELMREDEGWVRQQRRALLLGVWRGRRGRSGGGGSVGAWAVDELFDVQLLREVFDYVWES